MTDRGRKGEREKGRSGETKKRRNGENIQSLIIGANGLVGRQIGRQLDNKGIKWKGTYSKRAEDLLLKLDITNPADVEDIFSKTSPDVVFHCANLAGGVDFCEANPNIATGFHLKATKEIGSYCKDIDAMMVFISTDYVFDGTNVPYKEDAATNPLNLYGRLKLEAEQWIQQNLKRYLIIRTTNVYGWDPTTVTPNYIMGLYRSVKDGKSFNAPVFLWGNPTYAGDLAKAIVELYTKVANGIFHVVGSSFINRYEWAVDACKILGLDRSLLNKIEHPSPNMIPRPLKSWLNTDRFTSSYKAELHNAYDGLMLMKSDMEYSSNLD